MADVEQGLSTSKNIGGFSLCGSDMKVWGGGGFLKIKTDPIDLEPAEAEQKSHTKTVLFIEFFVHCNMQLRGLKNKPVLL